MNRLVLLGIIDAVAVALGLTVGMTDPVNLIYIVVGWLVLALLVAWRG